MNNRENRSFTRWIAIFAAVSASLFALIIAAQIVVDPFGVWQLYDRPGFNRTKATQYTVERLFKSYQYEMRPAETVIIGDSRVLWGFKSEWPETTDGSVYNFGLGSLQADEMESILRFVSALKQVKRVIIGSGTMVFDRNNWNDRKELNDRFRALVWGPVGTVPLKIKETCLSLDAVAKSVETVKVNRANKGGMTVFDRGWRVLPDGLFPPNRLAYKTSIWNYARHFDTVQVHDTQVAAHERTLGMLEAAGIDYEVFFPPMSEDLLLLLFADPKKWDELEKAKRALAAGPGFIDFAYLNAVTRNRHAFTDVTHFRAAIGRKIAQKLHARMSAEGRPDPHPSLGIFVDEENIDAHLKTVRNAVENAARARKAYLQVLRSIGRKKNVFLNRLDAVIPF